jgi:hypothetical protein
MKMKNNLSIAGFALMIIAGGGCATSEHAGYWPPPQPGLPPSRRPLPPPPVVNVQRSAPPPSRPPARHVEVVFTSQEREVIERYLKSCESEEREQHGKKRGWKGRGLPPGLAKKVDQGRGLPPGWERKLEKGSIMSVEVYQQSHSLPPELTVQLPVPPVGTVTIALDGRIVRLIRATREILDVLEVGR